MIKWVNVEGGAAHLLRFFFQKSCVSIREKPPQLYDDVLI